MKILFATPEATPYFKTGGLGNVARALPDALAARGHDVRLILPFYRAVRQAELQLHAAGMASVPWSGRRLRVRFLAHEPANGARTLFVEQDGFFDLDDPYGWPENDRAAPGRRFAFFCRAVLERARRWGADVVHLNDWQTGWVPVYGLLDDDRPATVFAIHNLGYQGNFAPSILADVGLPHDLLRTENGVEFYGTASFMKGALALSDRLVTVSPTYAREIQRPEAGAGMDGMLRFRRRDLRGILNGVDARRWDPATDPHIAAHYDADRPAGKEACRTALLAELGFHGDAPLIAMVTRLAHQKGIDLVLDALDRILTLDVRLAILGDGGPEYQDALTERAAEHDGRLRTFFAFDEPLAHRLYAGADFLLMPSVYEPCGLGQMIAQRYGTVPVVRRTGGLADTVNDGDTGFDFVRFTPDALLAALRRARKAWNGEGWQEMQSRCMKLDRSWDRAAGGYEEVYRAAIGDGGPREKGAG
ncbi:MAG: glycogen/starch synthase, partial [Gemmatimonadota bacterium]